MRRILVLLALGFTAALQASFPTGSIDGFIDGEMPRSGAPGLAYASIENGIITTQGERGVLDQGQDAAVAENSTFALGSVSKSFTALAVMQLVEAGKLDLDTPISRYLATFQGKPGADITVRQLLSHTSGFSTLQGNLTQTDFTMDSEALQRRVAIAAELVPATAAGEVWAYSNANYQVLGRLIEVASQQSYADYVEANVLAPAGMADSFVHDGRDHSNMANGHRPWFGGKRALDENMSGVGSGPQGGIVASARDVARYLAIMMNGADDLISAESKALMMSPAGDASPEYGFGWFVDSQDRTVFHSGANPGYEALATMVPAERKAAVILVNAGSGTGFGETIQLRNGITAKALSLDYNGEAGSGMGKATFISLAVLPILFLLSTIWAWRNRSAIRAKSGAFGTFSLWFPLLTTLIGAWAIFSLVPSIFGAPFTTIALFQPDMGLLLAATAVMGVVWAVFRLAIKYWPAGR